MRMDDIGYHHRHDVTFVIDRPNGAGDWLFLIVKTPAVFRIGEEAVHTPPNTILLYTPEYPQYYTPDSEEYIDDWMHFGPDEEEQKLMQELKIPLNQPVQLNDISNISAVVRNMCYEYYSAHIHKTEIVDAYFRILLYKLHEQLQLTAPSMPLTKTIYSERLLWIRESIYRWPAKDWNVDVLAEELSLSRSRFQHLYADAFGASVTQDLIRSRIQLASDLLKKNELSIEEIASECGYSSTSYFIRQFKKFTGQTPAQFRNR